MIALRNVGYNRLTIGIETGDNEALRLMNFESPSDYQEAVWFEFRQRCHKIQTVDATGEKPVASTVSGLFQPRIS